MKNILVLILMVCSISLFSQGYKSYNNGAVIDFPQFAKIGGNTADTLAKNDTLDIIFRVKGEGVQTMLGRLYIDKVSGTVSDTVYLYGAFGTSSSTGGWVGIDTIRNSNVSDGYKAFTQSRWTAFSYPYIIVRNIANGGAAKKSIRHIEIIGRTE